MDTGGEMGGCRDTMPEKVNTENRQAGRQTAADGRMMDTRAKGRKDEKTKRQTDRYRRKEKRKIRDRT